MNIFIQIVNKISKIDFKIKLLLFFTIWLAAYVLYTVVFQAGWIESVHYAIAMFALNVKTGFPNTPEDMEVWLYIVGLIAALYTVLSLISLLAKRIVETKTIVETSKNSYILVCGLGKKASAYIDSELSEDKNTKIIAIEKDPSNVNIDKFREKGVAVKVANAVDIEVLQTLNVENAMHIVALAGRDTENLDIALALRDVLRKKGLPSKKLYIHLENRELDKFYKDGGLLDDSSKLEIKVFNMARNSAKTLFLEHNIDGSSREYMDSDKPFSIVVTGNSKLAIEVIGQACEIAHLPNENEMTIFCIDKDIDSFRQVVEYSYEHIDEIPNIKVEYIPLTPNSRSFFEHELWSSQPTNIMLCYEDEQTNLNVAAELADSTYLEQIVHKTMKSQIHIAIYDNKTTAENIHKNDEHFKYFNIFAQISKMASRKMIIDEKFEIMAKCIHSGYVMHYDPDAMFSVDEEIDKTWNNTAKLTDRVSNRAQAFHIPVKLKALGLGFEDSDMSPGERLLHNKKQFATSILQKDLRALKLDKSSMQKRTEELVGDNQWSTQGFSYFPEDYNTLMEKLLRAEHNRWNAHHWLKGWRHNDVKNSKSKQHDCLVPLENLPDDKRHTIIYDIYSVLYIPNLLAKSGYIINKCEKNND